MQKEKNRKLGHCDNVITVNGVIQMGVLGKGEGKGGGIRINWSIPATGWRAPPTHHMISWVSASPRLLPFPPLSSQGVTQLIHLMRSDDQLLSIASKATW